MSCTFTFRNMLYTYEFAALGVKYRAHAYSTRQTRRDNHLCIVQANTAPSLSDNPNEINTSYGWHFQYLTIIGLTLATTTFAIALFADIFNSRRLFQAKNALTVCSAPLEVLVSALYWSLSAVSFLPLPCSKYDAQDFPCRRRNCFCSDCEIPSLKHFTD